MIANTAGTHPQNRTEQAAIAAQAAGAFKQADCLARPFRHWKFRNALPEAVYRDLIALPLPPPPALDSLGKRSSLNEHRRYFSPDMQDLYPVARMVANVFQDELVIRAIETLCGIDCGGSCLRIEYCQDHDGFWLEPHMDIKEKLMTMQIYLNTGPDAPDLGTDMYDSQSRLVSRGSGELGEGLVFLPSEPESWHGFEKRPISGVRRSLLVNYVTKEWRARQELSFPDSPIPAR